MDEQPHSPDPFEPIDDVAESSPGLDYASHVRTFNAVVSAAKWFVIHVLILLVSLYCLGIAHQPVLGAFGILCSIVLLIGGLLRRPSVRADLAKGLQASPASPRDAHIDHSPGLKDRTA